MLNTLDDYIWRSVSDSEIFVTNPNLTKKVDDNRDFRGFIGNTTVFLLDESTKRKISSLQDELYAAADFILAKPLESSTFHMTLHDLINGPEGEQGLEERMTSVVAPVRMYLQQFRTQPSLKMHTTWMFNMVNTSIVLGLKPADEDSYRRLDAMYQALEQIVPLGYTLTPHITLAYFRPGCYTAAEAAKLSHALRAVEMEITLRMENLVLQNFADMNHYETVF